MAIIKTTQEFQTQFPNAIQTGGGIFDVGNGGKYKLSSTGQGYEEVTAPAAVSERAVRYPGGSAAAPAPSELDTARASLFGKPEDRTLLDETGKAKVRSDVRQQFQDYLDAVNSNFNRLLTEEKARGTQRLGQTRAAAAAGGTLGGSFGDQSLNTMGGYNASLEAGVEEKRNLTLADVFSKIDERAQKEIDAQQSERLGKANAYIGFLTGAKTEAQDNIKTLASSGVKTSQIPEQRYQQLLRQSGMDPLQFDAFYNANLPASMKPTITDTTTRLPNGNAGMLRIETDPQTGKSTNKYFDYGVTHEQLFGQYPGGTKEVDGVLYGIKSDNTLVPLTKKTTSLKDLPTSRQEWELAGGQSGTGKTYADFLKEKNGNTFKPTADEKSAVNRYLTTLGATTENFKQAETNPEFFYGILEKAVNPTGAEKFNIQPFKYPFGFGPG